MKTNFEKSGTLLKCISGSMGRWFVLTACLMILGFVPRTMAQAPTQKTKFTILAAAQASGTTTSLKLPYYGAANIKSYKLKTAETGVTFASGDTAEVAPGTGEILFELQQSGSSLPAGDYTIEIYLYSDNACQAIQEFIVSVKPIPTFTPADATPAFCTGEGNVAGTLAGAAATDFKTYKYSYTVSDLNGIIGDVSDVGKTVASSANLSLDLALTNNAAEPKTIVYTVKPYALYEIVNLDGKTDTLEVAGAEETITMTISPTLNFTLNKDTICSGGTPTINITSSNTGGTGIIEYAWKCPKVTDITPEGSDTLSAYSTMSALPTVALTNGGTAALDVTYIVRQQITIDGVTCAKADSVTTTVTVHPQPVITLDAGESVLDICTEGEGTIAVISDNTGLEYNVGVKAEVDEINETEQTAYTPLSTPFATGDLTLTGSDYKSVIYVIRPRVVAMQACTGDSLEVTVNVNPQPDFTLSVTTDTICNGEEETVTITPIGTYSKTVSYDITPVSNTNIEGAQTATGIEAGDWSVGTLNNKDAAAIKNIQTQQFDVKAKLEDITCEGSKSFSIAVVPTIVLDLTVDQITACSDDVLAEITIGSDAGMTGIAYNWKLTYPTGDLSFSPALSSVDNGDETVASGTGNFGELTITNTNSANPQQAVTAKLSAQASYEGCLSDEKTKNIVVNPKPAFTLGRQ